MVSPAAAPKFATVNMDNFNEYRPSKHFEYYKRSLDNSKNVKGYFENKLTMRRSIDKKMHYDSIVTNADISQYEPPVVTRKPPQHKAEKKMLNNLQKTSNIVSKFKTPKEGGNNVNYHKRTLASGGAAKLVICSPEEEQAS